MRVWWRPIAVTHQVASSGSAPTAAIRLCEVAASAPGQPTTMLIRSGDGRTPRRAKSSAASMCPISKASISSGMPSSAARAAMPSVSCGSVGKRSRPKFSEPVSMPLMSGRASRPVERCSIVMPMAPPVETIVTMSQASRIWSMAAVNSSADGARRAVGLAHVQVRDRGAGRVAGGDVGRDLLRRVRHRRVVLARHLGAGRGDDDDDGVLRPAEVAVAIHRPALGGDCRPVRGGAPLDHLPERHGRLRAAARPCPSRG